MTALANTLSKRTPDPAGRDTSPQDTAQTSPAPFYPQHDYKYEVQMLFDLQKSMGEVTAAIKTLTQSQDDIRRKVDDLVRWKAMIIGGAIVLGAFSSVIGFAVAKGWDYISFGKVSAQATTKPDAPGATGS